METEFTPILSLVGGGLIGLSSIILMLTVGRIAGISGIVSRLLPPHAKEADNGVNIAFVLGLLVTAPLYFFITGSQPEQIMTDNVYLLVAAGLLVGFGTVLGNGCTSGHGVCGLSRFSRRSLIATIIFMFTAFLTVFVMRHII